MFSIRTAVIPAAGLGTRLLPATKTIPKELIPMLARPSIEYVMEEAVDAGITQFVIVVGGNGELMEDYFTPPTGYENLKAELNSRFDGLNYILSKASVRYVQQDEPKGLGHAVFCAEDYVEDEYFAVILPDDIIVQDPPCLANLMNVGSRLNGGALAVMQVPPEKVSSYGVSAQRLLISLTLIAFADWSRSPVQRKHLLILRWLACISCPPQSSIAFAMRLREQAERFN